MSLAVHVKKTLGDFTVTAKFQTGDGITALFGPSGSGKTTIINMIAGLIRPDAGRIAIDTTTLFNSQLFIDMPPHRREVGYVFQEGRLFPHLSVKQNIHYGRWMRGIPEDPDDIARVMTLLALEPLLERRTANLSGGERQRVAIARALLCRPRVLLLDEPLASLDAARKQEIFPFLIRLRDDVKIPMVYVSHQIAELKRIATSVVRIDAGQALDSGGLELLDQQDLP